MDPISRSSGNERAQDIGGGVGLERNKATSSSCTEGKEVCLYLLYESQNQTQFTN